MKIQLNLARTSVGVYRTYKDHAYYEWEHPTKVRVCQSADGTTHYHPSVREVMVAREMLPEGMMGFPDQLVMEIQEKEVA